MGSQSMSGIGVWWSCKDYATTCDEDDDDDDDVEVDDDDDDDAKKCFPCLSGGGWPGWPGWIDNQLFSPSNLAAELGTKRYQGNRQASRQSVTSAVHIKSYKTLPLLDTAVIVRLYHTTMTPLTLQCRSTSNRPP
jgi:hypothetical protein